MNKNKIAIVIVAYNRVDSLKRILSSISKVYYEPTNQVTLIISVDKSNTDKVEKFAEDFVWQYGAKIVDKHESNMGLRDHMLSLGKWFIEFDAIIVLEDDLVVAEDFYNFSNQAVERFSTNPNVAGISLYSFKVNYETANPFDPIRDVHDTYFMNCAMSWGEVWMKDSWRKFYDWYQEKKDSEFGRHLPHNLRDWGPKSWLKYHSRYCIENNKYFIYPYTSLTTNSSDPGTHSQMTNTEYQVPLLHGRKQYYFPNDIEDSVCYDGFFENKSLYIILSLSETELCIDLNKSKQEIDKFKYWLTTRKTNYKIIKSFGLFYRPLEENVIMNVPGNDIFLYDTTVKVSNKFSNENKLFLYHYYRSEIISFIKMYGFRNLCNDLYNKIKERIIRKLL